MSSTLQLQILFSHNFTSHLKLHESNFFEENNFNYSDQLTSQHYSESVIVIDIIISITIMITIMKAMNMTLRIPLLLLFSV
jgi:hypothetical protein